MYIKQEFDLYGFEFWGGAREVVEEIEVQDRMLDLEELLVMFLFQGGCYAPEDVEINDFVWFEVPELMELYGEEEDY